MLQRLTLHIDCRVEIRAYDGMAVIVNAPGQISKVMPVECGGVRQGGDVFPKLIRLKPIGLEFNPLLLPWIFQEALDGFYMSWCRFHDNDFDLAWRRRTGTAIRTTRMSPSEGDAAQRHGLEHCLRIYILLQRVQFILLFKELHLLMFWLCLYHTLPTLRMSQVLIQTKSLLIPWGRHIRHSSEYHDSLEVLHCFLLWQVFEA